MIIGLLHGICRRRARPRVPIRGSYLTDGRRLFRVVSRFAGGHRKLLVALEDCLTLQVQLFDQSELAAMGLEAVAAGDSASAMSDELPAADEAHASGPMLTASGDRRPGNGG